MEIDGTKTPGFGTQGFATQGFARHLPFDSVLPVEVQLLQLCFGCVPGKRVSAICREALRRSAECPRISRKAGSGSAEPGGFDLPGGRNSQHSAAGVISTAV